MGKQSARLYFNGEDYKDIYFNGHYNHVAMYSGNTLLWRREPPKYIIKGSGTYYSNYGWSYGYTYTFRAMYTSEMLNNVSEFSNIFNSNDKGHENPEHSVVGALEPYAFMPEGEDLKHRDYDIMAVACADNVYYAIIRYHYLDYTYIYIHSIVYSTDGYSWKIGLRSDETQTNYLDMARCIVNGQEKIIVLAEDKCLFMTYDGKNLKEEVIFTFTPGSGVGSMQGDSYSDYRIVPGKSKIIIIMPVLGEMGRPQIAVISNGKFEKMYVFYYTYTTDYGAKWNFTMTDAVTYDVYSDTFFAQGRSYSINQRIIFESKDGLTWNIFAFVTIASKSEKLMLADDRYVCYIDGDYFYKIDKKTKQLTSEEAVKHDSVVFQIIEKDKKTGEYKPPFYVKSLTEEIDMGAYYNNKLDTYICKSDSYNQKFAKLNRIVRFDDTYPDAEESHFEKMACADKDTVINAFIHAS